MQYEARQSNVLTFLRASWFCFRNAIAGWTMFASSFIVSIVQMFLMASVFFFMATYVAPGASSQLAEFAGNYGGFIVLGFLGTSLFNSVARGLYGAVATGYWGAFWEFYDAFPRGIGAYLLGSMMFNSMTSILNFAIMLLVGARLFGVRFSFGNAGTSMVVLSVSMVAAVGLGLAAASMFFLANAKGWREPILWVTELASSLFAGTYFPRDVLPAWLQKIGDLLPHTHMLHSLRLVVLDGARLSNRAVQTDLIHLAVIGAILVIIGTCMFRLGLKKADRNGEFTRWV